MYLLPEVNLQAAAAPHRPAQARRAHRVARLRPRALAVRRNDRARARREDGRAARAARACSSGWCRPMRAAAGSPTCRSSAAAGSSTSRRSSRCSTSMRAPAARRWWCAARACAARKSASWSPASSAARATTCCSRAKWRTAGSKATCGFPTARTTGPFPGRRPGTMSAPKQLLSVADGMFLTVGMVIGVGIFKAPSIVAGNTSGSAEFLFAWLLGGVISLCGALVYAELSARHPETGGEYAFLAARPRTRHGVPVRLVAHDGDPDRRHRRGRLRVRRVRERDLCAWASTARRSTRRCRSSR